MITFAYIIHIRIPYMYTVYYKCNNIYDNMKTMTKKTSVNRDPDDLKVRVMNIKEELPDNWRNILLKNFPEYNNKGGLNLLHNVRHLRVADERVTLIMEEIARRYKKYFSNIEIDSQ
jgi:hypothetical protein